MTAVFYRWQILCSIAFCFLLTGFASADSHRNVFSIDSANYGDHIFESNLPGLNGCSLAGSIAKSNSTESRSTKSSVRPAPAATVPVDIEIDQFSLQRFGRIGLTPQCLFLDEASPQGYLETKISNTLKPARHSIYEHSGFQRIGESKGNDPYWEYYSDCDAWNVVFAQLPEINSESLTTQFAGSIRSLQSLTIKAVKHIDQLVYLSRQKEFEEVEMRGVEENSAISLPIQDAVIEGLKSLRPIVRGAIDNDLVRNPYHWLKVQEESVGSYLDGTPLAIVWSSLTQVRLLGRVGIPQRNGINRRNGVWKDNFSWIARKIQQVVGTIKIR